MRFNYPKDRLNALTDGIFAVAMTLLVLDLRIPDGVPVPSQAALIHALAELGNKFLPYLLSFYVLGVSWLLFIRSRTPSETVSRTYGRACLHYLLAVTLIPFSTILVGRFTAFPVATCLYVGNIGTMAGLSLRLLMLLPASERNAQWKLQRVSLIIMIASCVLTGALSFVIPGKALWALLLNAVAGSWQRRQSPPPGEPGTATMP